MQLIKSNTVNNNKRNLIFFSKDELKIILQLYSYQVSAGICKDYAIDCNYQKAIFSFFRNTYDNPIFQIEKRIKKKNLSLFEFHLTYNHKIIGKNISIKKILNILHRKFELFKINKKV